MKAQAMMEYLTTYSWVILTVTVILGILLASGVFNPAGYNKDYCVGVSQLDCYSIYSDFSPYSNSGSLRVNLRNSFGFKIKIQSSELKDESGNIISHSFDKTEVLSGEDFILSANLNNNNIGLGRLNRFTLTITYSPCSSSQCSSQTYTVKKVIYTSPQKV